MYHGGISLILTSGAALQDNEGNTTPVEVAIMLKPSAESEGTSPYVSLLDWYQLEKELVTERPMAAKNFWSYLGAEGGCMTEEEVKVSRCDQSHSDKSALTPRLSFIPSDHSEAAGRSREQGNFPPGHKDREHADGL